MPSEDISCSEDDLAGLIERFVRKRCPLQYATYEAGKPSVLDHIASVTFDHSSDVIEKLRREARNFVDAIYAEGYTIVERRESSKADLLYCLQVEQLK